jgi:L-alanine-DL-glutamate epimerase-like enolase superfamily enzyme
MGSGSPTVKLLEADLFERPVSFRLPFRFGAVTVREAPQAFVRVRIRLEDGREAVGQSAELMVPKWFGKNPALSNEDNFNQLRTALRGAKTHLLAADSATAFGLSASVEAAHHAACAQRGLGGLIASFGLALLDRAVLDALCKAYRLPAVTALQRNLPGLDARTAPDLVGFDLDSFLAAQTPAYRINIRHTVGMIDAIIEAEAPAEGPQDGLPNSLEAAITAYGHRFFKLKLSGNADADLDRLIRIASLLERLPDYRLTLDGNEQFPDADAVIALWEKIAAEPRLARFRTKLLFLEQPIARAAALSAPIHPLAALVPVEIDESDGEMGAFVAARTLGYTGISSKSCKGLYRAILNRARVEAWGRGFFMSAEDLTTQAGLGVQQDLLLAAFIGAEHIERNGHHYVNGMGSAPPGEQADFLNSHPDLYARAPQGHARLTITDGAVSLTSLLAAPGLGSAASPDWSALSPLAL